MSDIQLDKLVKFTYKPEHQISVKYSIAEKIPTTITEKNLKLLSSPKKDGDVGADLLAVSLDIKGTKVNAESEFDNLWTDVRYINYRTGIKVEVDQLSEPLAILAFPNSRIRKMNLILANSVGIIDPGYRGEISLSFKYIWSPRDLQLLENSTFGIRVDHSKIFQIGDEIGQLAVVPFRFINTQNVSQLSKTDRAEGGFGHTTKS